MIIFLRKNLMWILQTNHKKRVDNNDLFFLRLKVNLILIFYNLLILFFQFFKNLKNKIY